MKRIKKAVLAVLFCVCLASTASGEIIYDNFGEGDSYVPNSGLGVGCVLGPFGCILKLERSIPITVTATGTDHYLDYAALPLVNYREPGDMEINIREDDNGLPGDLLESQYVLAGPEAQVYTIQFSGNTVLEESQTYWVHLSYVAPESRFNWLETADVITGTVATRAQKDWNWSPDVQEYGAVRLGTTPLDPVGDALKDLQDGGNLHVFGRDPQDKMTAEQGILAGDVNGDHIPDLILTACNADGPQSQRDEAGEIYVYFGHTGLEGIRDVAGIEGHTPDLTVYGATRDDALGKGRSVVVGDLNGDRIQDLIMGAYQADGPQENRCDAGEVYVLFGSRSLSGTVDLNNGGADLIIYGANCGDNLGRDGAMTLGDLDNDQIPDLILAAPGADGPSNARDDCGEVYFIKGSTTLSGTLDLAQGQWNGIVYGATSYDQLGGDGCLLTGDLNADGILDVIVGAPYGDGPGDSRNACGEAYLLAGADNAFPSRDLAFTPPTLRVYGADSGDSLTRYKAMAVGDVNGDGMDDLALGAPYASGPSNSRSNCGEVHVIFGAENLSGVRDLDEDQSDMVIYGADNGDYLSKYQGLALGDLTGDGTDDIAMASSYASGPNNSRRSCGEVAVVFGSSDPPSIVDLDDNQQDLIIYGATYGDKLGYSATMVLGDMNGDGINDLVAASALADGPGEGRRNCGEAYVIHGGPNLPSTVDIFTGGQDVIIYGPGYDDRLADGGALAMGDINANGVPEAILGAYRADGPLNTRTCAGEAFGVSGARPPISATVFGTDHRGNPLAEDYGTARAYVDFETGDANSLTRVVLVRNKNNVDMEDTAKVANVQWLITTDRTNFAATLIFNYLDKEIQGLDESKLTVYSAPEQGGDYTPMDTAVDTEKNLLTVRGVQGFTSFVIVEGQAPPDEDDCFINSLRQR
ncbi:MAG: FG-GAP repeat protein [Desulfatibacillum sp.]|nr:FG-GAP repeat protein [Desulfatibacillum sp.]